LEKAGEKIKTFKKKSEKKKILCLAERNARCQMQSPLRRCKLLMSKEFLEIVEKIIPKQKQH
jgi:hypothetical protein